MASLSEAIEASEAYEPSDPEPLLSQSSRHRRVDMLGSDRLLENIRNQRSLIIGKYHLGTPVKFAKFQAPHLPSPTNGQTTKRPTPPSSCPPPRRTQKPRRVSGSSLAFLKDMKSGTFRYVDTRYMQQWIMKNLRLVEKMNRKKVTMSAESITTKPVEVTEWPMVGMDKWCRSPSVREMMSSDTPQRYTPQQSCPTSPLTISKITIATSSSQSGSSIKAGQNTTNDKRSSRDSGDSQCSRVSIRDRRDSNAIRESGRSVDGYARRDGKYTRGRDSGKRKSIVNDNIKFTDARKSNTESNDAINAIGVQDSPDIRDSKYRLDMGHVQANEDSKDITYQQCIKYKLLDMDTRGSEKKQSIEDTDDTKDKGHSKHHIHSKEIRCKHIKRIKGKKLKSSAVCGKCMRHPESRSESSDVTVHGEISTESPKNIAEKVPSPAMLSIVGEKLDEIAMCRVPSTPIRSRLSSVNASASGKITSKTTSLLTTDEKGLYSASVSAILEKRRRSSITHTSTHVIPHARRYTVTGNTEHHKQYCKRKSSDTHRDHKGNTSECSHMDDDSWLSQLTERVQSLHSITVNKSADSVAMERNKQYLNTALYLYGGASEIHDPSDKLSNKTSLVKTTTNISNTKARPTQSLPKRKTSTVRSVTGRKSHNVHDNLRNQKPSLSEAKKRCRSAPPPKVQTCAIPIHQFQFDSVGTFGNTEKNLQPSIYASHTGRSKSTNENFALPEIRATDVLSPCRIEIHESLRSKIIEQMTPEWIIASLGDEDSSDSDTQESQRKRKSSGRKPNYRAKVQLLKDYIKTREWGTSQLPLRNQLDNLIRHYEKKQIAKGLAPKVKDPKDSPTTVTVAVDPLVTLNTTYLRLPPALIADLEQECHQRGINPGLHSQVDMSNVDIEEIFSRAKSAMSMANNTRQEFGIVSFTPDAGTPSPCKTPKRTQWSESLKR